MVKCVGSFKICGYSVSIDSMVMDCKLVTHLSLEGDIVIRTESIQKCQVALCRSELSYLAPLGSENISAPYFKQCFFLREGVLPPRQSKTTPPSPKTEVTNILFYILNFASIIKFKM